MDYVLDTCVVLKWIIQEKDSNKALEIRQKYLDGEFKIIVPDLLFYEIVNGLRFSFPYLSVKQIKERLEEIQRLELEIISFSPIFLESAIEIMVNYRITIYDAYFLSLAKEFGLIFITADEKLYSKIEDLRYVKYLGHL
jgi:predicted nucleic acid-binding protein